ncbi:hypothetical protein [Clostridium sp. DL1XJH146]
MIKKMERRFTIVAISVISLVLFFLVLAVQMISSQVNIRKADVILSSIAEESSDVILGNMGFMDRDSIRTFSVMISKKGNSENFETRVMDFVEEDVAMAM